ncbi:hypothetical protein JCM5296_006096 [Sporobolomyces johnsonii]
MADPAFRGFVETTLDALLIFEGCKRGFLPKISRRLQDYEKRALVVSGAVFVFDEEETGIKRWTDGLSWSPSRTLGNFLVYRELDKKAAQAGGNEDDEGASASSGRLMGGLTSKADPIDDTADLAPVPSTSTARPTSSSARQRSLSEVAGVLQLDRARERALVGSLTSSYRFRSDGLVKKTISLSGLHLIGYYRIDDVTSGRLRTPSSHAELMALEVSSSFLSPSLFRMPPLVEIGADGQLRYKGESDAPLSPLTRSGSSQGFPTPALSQSRPTSSDSYSGAGPSHFTPLLGACPPSRDYPSQPGSPRRGAVSTFRSSNRFDPYSVGRFSPNAVYANSAGYPFPGAGVPPGQPSPNRSTFAPIGEPPLDLASQGVYRERTPPHSDALSSSAPVQGMWMGPPGGSGGPYAHRGSFAGESTGSSSNFYQPRQATPFVPASEAAGPSNAIFAYNPPPPVPTVQPNRFQQPHPTERLSPQIPYHPYPPSQHYELGHDASNPPQNLAQQLPLSQTTSPYPHQPSPSVESQHSPFATPPSSAHAQARPHYPFPQVVGGQTASSRSQTASAHGSPVPAPGWAVHRSSLGDITASLPQRTAPLTAELPPHSPPMPAVAHAPPRHRGTYEQVPQPSYATYSLDSTSVPPHAHPTSAYSYPDAPHQASGLVMGFSNDADSSSVPPQLHGLGVTGDPSIGGSLYRDAVPAPSGSPFPLAYGGSLGHGLRQPVRPVASVSLSSQHAYAASLGHPPSPYGPEGNATAGTLAGVLDRDGDRAAWSVKREEVPPPGGWWQAARAEGMWAESSPMPKKEFPHG